MNKVMLLAALSIVALGGCGGREEITASDRASSRAIAVATHNAIQTHNNAALVELTAPEFRKPMRSVLSAVSTYNKEADKTAAMLAQRVGAAPADRLRRETADIYRGLLPSPLEGAVAKDESIDWKRTEVREGEAEMAWAYIDGRKSPFHSNFVFSRIKGQWYVQPLNTPQGFRQDAKRMTDNYRKSTDTLKKIQNSIRKGEINPSNVDAKLWPTGR